MTSVDNGIIDRPSALMWWTTIASTNSVSETRNSEVFSGTSAVTSNVDANSSSTRAVTDSASVSITSRVVGTWDIGTTT